MRYFMNILMRSSTRKFQLEKDIAQMLIQGKKIPR